MSILGAFGGQEQEAFMASLEKFEADAKITIVNYTPDKDFTTTPSSSAPEPATHRTSPCSRSPAACSTSPGRG